MGSGVFGEFQCPVHGVRQRVGPESTFCPDCADAKRLPPSRGPAAAPQRTVAAHLAALRLPPEYAAATMAGWYRTTESRVASADRVWEVVSGRNRIGLIVVGPPGTGKTYLGAALCRAYIEAGKGCARMVDSPGLRGGHQSHRFDEAEWLYPDLLVIDGLGTDLTLKALRAEGRLIGRVVILRAKHQKPTVLISNLRLPDRHVVVRRRRVRTLRDVLDESVLDRMRTVRGCGGAKVVLDGPSLRGRDVVVDGCAARQQQAAG
ncbi:MAG: ATP-binding protein [Nitrospirota bacterium]|nr:ATP-binding protein [Nitrospirota bacterium]